MREGEKVRDIPSEETEGFRRRRILRFIFMDFFGAT